MYVLNRISTRALDCFHESLSKIKEKSPAFYYARKKELTLHIDWVNADNCLLIGSIVKIFYVILLPLVLSIFCQSLQSDTW